MLQNYLKIAWRSLWQNKIYSFVNLSGLTIGLSVVMLIMLYVQDDLSFDRFHRQEKQLYRLVQDRREAGGVLGRMGTTGFPQGPVFSAEIPEIQACCRIKNGWNTLVKKGNTAIEEKLLYADSTFFTLFSFNTLSGHALTALGRKENIVITDRMAKKYFGDTDPVGQTMEVGDEGGGAFKTFQVAAVVQHPPLNSTLQFDLLLPIVHTFSPDPEQRARDNSWYNANLNTFLLLRPDVDTTQLREKMALVTARHLQSPQQVSSGRNADLDVTFRLQPLTSIHLDTDYFATNGLEYWSDSRYPKILSLLGLFILLIACVNFINISLARALRRAREIGIRKSVGGARQQLVAQFMGEAFLTTMLAFIPALFLTRIFLPVFCKLMDKQLDSSSLFQPQTLLMLGGLLLLVAFLAGFYPALVISRFPPIDSLKGRFTQVKRPAIGVALVVFQFAIAGTFIIGATIASRQFDYIATKDLGYKTDNILRFWLPWDQIEQIGPKLKAELSQLARVEKISAKSGDRNCTKYNVNGATTDWVYYEHIDANHLQLMGIPLLSGRYLSYQNALDTVSNMVVNEAFVRQFLKPGQDPMTTPIRQGKEQVQIVGIVKDFHYASFKEKIRPMVWALDKGTQAGCIHVQISPDNPRQTLAAIQDIYRKFVPYLPMEYFFLEEYRMLQYADDLRWRRILDYATLFAVLIACLGLFGLTTFMAERRTKEIGIRKVLGASVTGMVGLLAKDFLQWVLLALVIASPIAYYFMQLWLSDFAYRIEIQAWMFAVAGLIAVFIAFLTIGFQSVKAALANPVKSLRNE